MLTFLFWNIQKKDNLDLISQLVREKQVDFIILAESLLQDDKVLTELNKQSVKFHINHEKLKTCRRIAVYSKFSDRFVKPAFDSRYSCGLRLKLPSGSAEILLFLAHLLSKRETSEFSQSEDARKLSAQIAEIENKLGHQRTIVVGDFNMNPFERGIIAASGFHATMDRKIAVKRKWKRKIGEEEYPFFYNPMWSLFGDASRGLPGTYYYDKGKYDIYFWNMFDQVLLRPDILDLFDNQNLSIIDKIGELSLLKANGTPNKKIASDHLPILFRLTC